MKFLACWLLVLLVCGVTLGLGPMEFVLSYLLAGGILLGVRAMQKSRSH